jgi:hypothetical protein
MIIMTNHGSAIRWIDPPKSYDEATATKHKMPSKRVYICSPFRGNVKRNTERAREYCRLAFERGFVPIAPHLYFPQFLDEDDKDERAAGLRYGMEEMHRCVEIWIFGKRVTDGMKAEIELAADLGIPARYFDESAKEVG